MATTWKRGYDIRSFHLQHHSVGPLPDRMYAIVSGLVRSGMSVVVGPISGLEWSRMMPGNKWDWQRYWVTTPLGRRRKTVEPTPKHMIIPVETKEEAVNMAACFNIAGARVSHGIPGWLP